MKLTRIQKDDAQMSVTNHLPVGRGKLTETVVAGDAVKVLFVT